MLIRHKWQKQYSKTIWKASIRCHLRILRSWLLLPGIETNRCSKTKLHPLWTPKISKEFVWNISWRGCLVASLVKGLIAGPGERRIGTETGTGQELGPGWRQGQGQDRNKDVPGFSLICLYLAWESRVLAWLFAFDTLARLVLVWVICLALLCLTLLAPSFAFAGWFCPVATCGSE